MLPGESFLLLKNMINQKEVLYTKEQKGEL